MLAVLNVVLKNIYIYIKRFDEGVLITITIAFKRHIIGFAIFVSGGAT